MIDFGFGVELGPLDSRYSEHIREWRNDPDIRRWCRQNDVISDVEQEEWFERQSKDKSIRMYAVSFNRLLSGVCGLTSIDMTNRRAEFSLYIAPGGHGKGIGTKALATLLSHGFRNLGLNLIWGETFDGNPAASMFEKLGMVKEGTRRQFYFRDGRFIDAHLYSITAAEWESRCKSLAVS